MNSADLIVASTLLSVAGIILLILLGSGLFTVEQQNRAIVERFGKFARVAGPASTSRSR